MRWTATTRHRASTSIRWHFAFGLCCHIARKHVLRLRIRPYSAQLGGTPYHSPSYVVRAVVWARGDGQTDTDARDHYIFRVIYDSREM